MTFSLCHLVAIRRINARRRDPLPYGNSPVLGSQLSSTVKKGQANHGNEWCDGEWCDVAQEEADDAWKDSGIAWQNW